MVAFCTWFFLLFSFLSKDRGKNERTTVHEMARDEARHGKAFAGLLKRYFG